MTGFAQDRVIGPPIPIGRQMFADPYRLVAARDGTITLERFVLPRVRDLFPVFTTRRHGPDYQRPEREAEDRKRLDAAFLPRPSWRRWL